MHKILFSLIFLILSGLIYAQGLEDVIIETYYISDANDATDTDGGFLEEGSVTYRVFIDMAEGYELQAVYGNEDHLLRIETSTVFFNNEDRGEETGDQIPDNRLDENTVALDSYVTMLAASDAHAGIPKELDTNGSIVGGVNNDGGSEGVTGGLLVNDDVMAGIPLTASDGLLDAIVPGVTNVGLDLSMFADVNDGTPFMSNGGAWSVLEGVQGTTDDNIVMILQITTTGDLEFELNIQLGAPDGGVEQYVANSPIGDEIYNNELTYPAGPIFGCMDELACNFNPDATEDDDSCLVPVEGCSECNETNDALLIIDSDGDGVCDAEEIEGCTSSETACNYNPDATDEVDCIEPVENCAECNETNTGLVLVDDDGDGICNADEVLGCTVEDACNFNPEATDDDGSCLVPEENCTECSEDNSELILIDDDGDGICNALENPGCTDPTACNYDSEASGDDGSCLVPVENCSVCNETNDALILIDDDGDGVCNAEEIIGCYSETACNYNPDATDEGDCIEPIEDCQACNETNDGLVIIDTDGDGICDLEEIPGCTSETACNYDPEATDDNDTCLEPVEDCTECEGEELIIIDTDGDGVCDAEEIEGCTSETACNYNPEATEEDDSCLEPVEDCWECDGEELVIIDEDGDGVCDGEEILGCTDPEAINYNPDATEDDGSCEYDISVLEQNIFSDVNLFPNPAKTSVELVINAPNAESVICSVRNLVGEVLYTNQFNIVSGKNSIQIDLEKYSDGIYFIELNSDNKHKILKLIKKS